MELSSEDALRLNVLLANNPLAIRIHESSMTLFGLLASGEATIKLNPTGNADKYLKQVRALLSERALGSPGGYPLYLQRWTRMGQMRDDSLQQLLLLGDPTAVFAVVCAEGLTDELARRAWWAAEEPENARRMLQTKAVVNGATGRPLALYLIEYLPFETDTEVMVESVSSVLQPGLLTADERQALWRRASRKIPYQLGFIAAAADDLPADTPVHRDIELYRTSLETLVAAGNGYAEVLLQALSANGQAFIQASLKILQKPPTQDVVATALQVIGEHLRSLRPAGDPNQTIEQLQADSSQLFSHSPEAAAAVAACPLAAAKLQALHLLSGVGFGVVRPVFRNSDAIGSLMRRKLQPHLDPVVAQLQTLLNH